MKQRPKPRSERDAEASMKALVKALAALDRPEDVAAFLEDLCTPAELEAMADRWRVVPLLLKGVASRHIQERTRVSVTTIGRVDRPLDRRAGGYAAAPRLQHSRPTPSHFNLPP